MNEQQQAEAGAKPRRVMPVVAGCVLLFVIAGTVAFLLWRPRQVEPLRSDTDVPLGVEQAVIIRYSGPPLAARPYRRGASLNLRIANEAQQGRVRVYDIRYVVSLPGEFDLTDYLTSTDGRPIDDLPPFVVRGLTSLTKDIETRIQEIENVGVHIPHWYHETLVGLGVLWLAWLAGLIFLGHPQRPRPPPVEPLPPPLSEQIDALLTAMAKRELTVPEKARLEALLLQYWREQLGFTDGRMAAACRAIAGSRELGPSYSRLQAWLHNPRSGVEAAEFVELYSKDASRHPHPASRITAP